MKLKKCLGVTLMIVLAAVCVRPTKGAFGIPDFLEFGRCSNATLKDGFDPVKYQGLWFTIQSVPNEYEHARRCNSMNFTWVDDERFVSVGKGVLEDGKKVKQVTEIWEECELREPPHPAYLTVSASGVPESPYEILSTDYVTYSCVHSCLEYFGFKAEFFWVLGRTPYLSKDYVALCHQELSDMGVDTKKLVNIPHDEGCPYTKKLGVLMENNRQLMIRLGVLDEGAPLLPSEPPPTTPMTEVEEEIFNVEMKPNAQAPMPPKAEDETILEDPLEDNSSAPLKANTIVIPLFVMVAVLLPTVAR